MGYHDLFRISAHAVITNSTGQILQLKATYGDKGWGLPGGCLEPNETIHDALLRECKEELNCDIKILYLSGMYFHKIYNSHACVFKCELPENSSIQLSAEHSEYRFFNLDELTPIQFRRISECLAFNGSVYSACF